jgi:hypothetical protein
MSGKTAVGAGDVTLGHGDVDDERGIASMVENALDGVEPEAIVYRANTGTLDDPADEWERYDAVADLPDRGIDGWDELYVYTETHVYRWLGVGFDAGPETIPRDPGTLPGGD